MKVRIKPASRGVKGVNWERFYIVQIKTFWFWNKWKEIKTLDEAADIMSLFNVTSIEYDIL